MGSTGDTTLDVLTTFSPTLLGFGLNNIFAFLGIALGLGLVIFFHELGHFAVAKWCNVNVERFSIGFGPIIWSRQKGETEYALSAIPFGGYVKMLGQDDMDPGQMTNDDIVNDPRSYPAKSVGQRMAIISAGVIMNVITGLLFFACAFKLGVMMPPPTVGFVVPSSPAYEAGVEEGDQITHVNGKEVSSFMDVTIGITLSSGSVQLQGVRKTGETFDLTVSPDSRNDTRRKIGIGQERGLTLVSWERVDDIVYTPGSPASKTEPKFLYGDKLVKVDGQEIAAFANLNDVLVRRRSEPLTFEVERKDGKTTEKMTVEPVKFRTLGIWMDIGTVSSIRKESPAATAGFKKDDKIIRVNELVVGTNIDPLRLPDYFAEQAGEEVEVEVRRRESGGGDTTATLKVTPLDRPGWTIEPISAKYPMPIPAIGLACPVTSRIVKVEEGSEAWDKGIREGQTVTKIEFIISEEPVDGYYSDRQKDASIALDLLDEKPEEGKPVEQINWGFAFWTLQKLPKRWVKLHVSDGDDGKPYDLQQKAQEYADDWYFTDRGLQIASAEELQKGETFGEAMAMGLHDTKNTATQIYLTLRSLVTGDLSPKELHGPIGIAKVGYQVAEQGFSKLFLFLGFLSINLAVINFLPIPVLDGGHMVFLIWEAITRRKPSERIVNAATYVGLAFVLSLMVFVLYLDIFVHT